LSYAKGIADGQVIVRDAIQRKLDELAVALPKPEASAEPDDGSDFEEE